MTYIHRDIENELLILSQSYSVITISGPRQSRKTTLAKRIFNELPYFNFENPDIRFLAINDPRGFLAQCPNGAILDEIQHVPEILSYLQQIVDERKKAVKYIITGSNQFSAMQKITQSLAGRTAILKLLPLSLNEISKLNNYSTAKLIYQGFYPSVISDKLNPTKAYRNYYETYLQRDLRQIVKIKDLNLFHKFIQICAGRIGNLFNASSIATEVGVSVPTIKSWISALEASFIILLLQPFYDNINKRLIKSPKIYFYDTGLASYLLGIEKAKQIVRDPLRGALFENMVIMEIVKARFNKGLDHHLYFYRDSHGNEIDLIFKRGNELFPVEIKSSQTFHNSFIKGLQYIENLFGNRISQQYLFYDGKFEHTFKHIIINNFKNAANIFDE